MPVTLEKYTVRGVTVRLKHLGHHRIEVITSDRKKELQHTLFKTIRNTAYTEETDHNRYGNLECRLLPSDKMSFKQLIQKVVNLIVRCIERYEKKMASAQSTPPRKKQRSKKQYRNHPALATT